MKMIRRKIGSVLLTLFALFGLSWLFATSAQAASPVAVWDGDFSQENLVQGNWTLDLNGNTANDGKITIGQAQPGVLITRSDSLRDPTVIFRYESLSYPATSTKGYVVVTSYAGNNSYSNNRTGIAVMGTGLAKAVWDNTENGTAGNAQTIPQSGTIGFYYQTAGGTYVYDGNGTTLYGAAGLKSSSDNSNKGFAIGGCRGMTTIGSNYSCAEGMIIKAIAVFDTRLTANEISSYRFPSDPDFKNYDWKYQNEGSSFEFGSGTGICSIEAGKQKKLAFKAVIDESFAESEIQMFKYSGDSNDIYLKRKADGTLLLQLNRRTSGNWIEATSTTTMSCGEGHVFAMLVRRGVSGSGGHAAYIGVYMDGVEIVHIGDGTSGAVGFDANPMRTCIFGGGDQSANTYTAYAVDKEDASAAGAETSIMPLIAADAEKLFNIEKFTSTFASEDTVNWSNIVWDDSKEFPQGGGNIEVELTVNAATTLAIDQAISVAALKLKGTSNLTIDASAFTLTAVKLNTTDYSGTLTIKGGTWCPSTIPANKTYCFDGVTSSNALTINGTLQTRNTCSLSSGSNLIAAGGTLTVVDGTTTFNTADQGIKGTLNIEAGATFINSRGSDAVTYSGASTINIKGTLSLGNTRWTVCNQCNLNLYPGCLITGAGQSTNGAFDFYQSGSGKVNVATDSGTADVNIECAMRFRDYGDTTFTNNSGAKVKISGTLYGNKRLTLAGTGAYELSSSTINCSVTVAGGTTLIPNGSVGGTVAVSSGTIIKPINQTANINNLSLPGSGTVSIDLSGITNPAVGNVLTFTTALADGYADKLVIDSTKVPDGFEASVTASAVTLAVAYNNQWSGSGGNNLWTNADNWNTHSAPAAGDKLLIPVTSATTIELDSNVSAITFGKVAVNGAGLTLGGSGTLNCAELLGDAITLATADVALNVTGTLANNLSVKAGTTINAGSITGTITVDATGAETGATLISGTAANSANIVVTGLVEGQSYKLDNGVLKVCAATDSLIYGHAFNDSREKEAEARSPLNFNAGSTSTYEYGVNDKALHLNAGRNWGENSSAFFPAGDWTMIIVAKQPTTASPIFAVGDGQYNEEGLLCFRSCSDQAGRIRLTRRNNNSVQDMVSRDVTNGSTYYHTYAIVFDSATQKLKISVDKETASDWVDYTPCTSGKFQFSAVFGLAGTDTTYGAQANDGAVDEFRLYGAKLSSAQIAAIADAFADSAFVWTGNANDNQWATAGNWQGNAVPRNGAIVQIAIGANSKTITLPNDGTAALAALEVTGSDSAALTLDGGTLNASAVTISAATTLDLAADSDYTFAGSITGEGTLKKSGSGALTINAAVNPGAFIVAGGTLKLPPNGSVATDEFTKTFTVENGATFDLNGYQNTQVSVVLNGGTLTNGGNDITAYDKQIAALSLTADSTISGNSFGYVRSGHAAGTLDLGTYTLTVAMNSDKKFSLDNTTVSGSGAIIVSSGILASEINASTIPDAAVTLNAGAKFEADTDLTIGHLTLSGFDFNDQSDKTIAEGQGVFTVGEVSGLAQFWSLVTATNATVARYITPELIWVGGNTEQGAAWGAENNWKLDNAAFTWFDGCKAIFNGTGSQDFILAANTVAERIAVTAGGYNGYCVNEVNTLNVNELTIAAGAEFNVNNIALVADSVSGKGTLKFGSSALIPGSLTVGQLNTAVKCFAGATLNATYIGSTIIIDATGKNTGDVVLLGTGCALAKRVEIVGVADATVEYEVVDEVPQLKLVADTRAMRYGHSFDNNLNKREEATSALTLSGSHSYIYGKMSKALKLDNGQNWGGNFAYPSGDWTIVAVAKAPSGNNQVIFSVGGQSGTAGLFCFRTCGDNWLRITTVNQNDIKALPIPVEEARRTYHTYVFIYDSTRKAIGVSVDGSILDWSADNSFTAGSGVQFQFGGIHGGGTNWAGNANDGAIDEFRMYEYQISDTAIKNLANEFGYDRVYTGVGEWNNPSRWTGGKVPATADSVIIDAREADAEVTLTTDTAQLSIIKLIGANNVRITGIAHANTFNPAMDLSDYTGTLTMVIDSGVAASCGISCSAAAKVVYEVAQGVDVTMAEDKLVGCLDFTKSGPGTLTLARNVTSPSATAAIRVTEGVLKHKRNTNDTTENAKYYVSAGATYDTNGAQDKNIDYFIAGTLRNTGNGTGTGLRQMHSITLTGDATISGTAEFGLVAGSYAATTLALGEYTLTINMEDATKSFHLVNTTISGSGKIDVVSGTLHTYNTACIGADATITVKENGALSLDAPLTVANLDIEKDLSVGGSQLMTVNGTLTANGAVAMAKLGFGASVTLKPVGTGAVVVSSELTFAENARVNVDFENYTIGKISPIAVLLYPETEIAEGTFTFANEPQFWKAIVSGTAVSLTRDYKEWDASSSTGNWTGSDSWNPVDAPLAGSFASVTSVETWVTVTVDADTAKMGEFKVVGDKVMFLGEGTKIYAESMTADSLAGNIEFVIDEAIVLNNNARIDTSCGLLTVNSLPTFGANTTVHLLSDAPTNETGVKVLAIANNAAIGDITTTVTVYEGESDVATDGGDHGFFLENRADGVYLCKSTVNAWLNKTGDGNWSTADNWRWGAAPAAGENVRIDVGASDVLITMDADSNALGSFTVNTTGAGKLIIGGDHILDAGTASGTITIESTATVKASKDSALTVLGVGTFIPTGTIFTANNEYSLNSALQNSFQDGANWTGTVWLKNQGGVALKNFPQYFGNTNSKLQLTGLSGWAGTDGQIDFRSVSELILTDEGETKAINQLDGQDGRPIHIGKLSGDGTLNTKNVSLRITIDDASDFSGSIDLGTENTSAGIAIGTNCNAAGIYIAEGVSCAVASGKTWSCSTITVDGTLTKVATATVSGTLKGHGTFVQDMSGNTTNPTAQTGANNNEWTGTYWLKNTTTTANEKLNIASFGNASSTIRLTNVEKRWLDGNVTISPTIEIVNDENGKGWNIFNGSSSKKTTFTKLKGDGLLKIDGGSNQGFVVTDGSEFSGSINLSGHGLTFGNMNDIGGSVNKITIDSGKVITCGAGSVWTASAGVFVNGTISGSGTIENATTFGVNAIIDISQGVLTVSSATINGDFTLKVAGEAAMPEGEVLHFSNAASAGLVSGCFVTIVGENETSLENCVAVRTTTGLIISKGETFVWKGTEGAVLTEGTSWENDPENIQSLYDFHQFGATDTRKTIKVGEDTQLGIVTVAGEYQFVRNDGVENAVTVRMTDLQIEENGSLCVGNGVTLEFGGATPALDKFSFTPGGKISFKNAPAFNSSSVFNITNDSETAIAPGVYPVAEWTGVIPDTQAGGYGKPEFTISGPKDENYTYNLVCQVGRVVLQVRTPEEAARPPVKIWCLGDSITEGYDSRNTSANYRIQLAQMLSLLGYNVKMLGELNIRSITPAGETAPDEWAWHTGISAQRVWTAATGGYQGTLSNRRAGLMESLDAHIRALGESPDVVLLNIGYNDISANDSDGHLFNGWKQLVDKLLVAFPNAKVVATTIAPHTFEGGQYTYLITNYHSRMREAVNSGVFPEGRVALVDLHTALAERKEAGVLVQNSFDNTHPTWIGHKVQAETFLPEITNFIGVNGLAGAPKIERIFNSLTLTERYIDITFDRPLDPASLNAANITLARASGEEVTLANSYTLSDDRRTVRIRQATANLNAGTEYRVTFTGLRAYGATGEGDTVSKTFKAMTFGAKNNIPNSYLEGFFHERTINVPEEMAVTKGENAPNINVDFNYDPDNIGAIGYYIELVRKGTDELKYVWVDMATFANQGETMNDLILPTKVTHRGYVSRMHVKSNVPGILDVGPEIGTVSGFIEFSPNDATGATSGTAPRTIFHDPKSGCANGMDWNDSIGNNAGRGMMQIFRVHGENESEQDAELIFAYNNWGQTNTGADGTKAGEIGFGDYCQHWLTDTSAGNVGALINAKYGNGNQALDENHISSDYTGTRFSPYADKINAKAYSVRRIELWIRADAADLTWVTGSGEWNQTDFNNNKVYTGDSLHAVIFGNMTDSTDDLVVNVNGDRTVKGMTFSNTTRKTILRGDQISASEVTMNGDVQIDNIVKIGALTQGASSHLTVNGEFYVTGNATLNGNIYIPKGATFSVLGTITGNPTITGAGDFIIGNLPANGSSIFTSLQDAAHWTGRLTLKQWKNAATSSVNYYSVLGSTSSIVCYNGVSGYPWLAWGKQGNITANTITGGPLEISETGFAPDGQFTNYVSWYKVTRLIGNGLLNMTMTSAYINDGTQFFAVEGDLSAFAGSINGPLENGYRIFLLGPGDSYPNTRNEYVAGQLFIGRTAVVNIVDGQTWVLTSLRNAGSLGGSGKLQGNIIFDANSTYRAHREGPLTVTGSVTQKGALTLDCTELDLDHYFPRAVGIGERVQFITASTPFTLDNVSLITNNVTKGVWKPYVGSASQADGVIYSIGIELVSISPAVYLVNEFPGFNFAERKIIATVENFRPGSKARLVVRNAAGEAVFETPYQTLDHDGDYEFMVEGLTPSDTYSYEVQEDFFGAITTVLVDVFNEANIPDTNWIYSVSNSTVNGSWDVTPEWSAATGIAPFDGKKVFNITDASASANATTYVTFMLNFTEFVAEAELASKWPATDFKGAVVPVQKTDSEDRAWFGVVNGEWKELTASSPLLNHDYEIDMFFDYRNGSTPTVTYLVTSDQQTFEALRIGNIFAHPIADPAGDRVTSVPLLGKGYLRELNGQVLDDTAIIVNGTHYKVDEVQEGFKHSTAENPALLTTNVRFRPTESGEYYINKGDWEFEIDTPEMVEYSWDEDVNPPKLIVRMLKLYKWTGEYAENDHWSHAQNWLLGELSIQNESIITNWVKAVNYPGESELSANDDIVLFPANAHVQVAFSEDISIYRAVIYDQDEAVEGDDIVFTTVHTTVCGTRTDATLSITHNDGVRIGKNRKVKVMGWSDGTETFPMTLVGEGEVHLYDGAKLDLVDYGQLTSPNSGDMNVILSGESSELNVYTNSTVLAVIDINNSTASCNFDIGTNNTVYVRGINSVAGVVNNIKSGMVWVQNPEDLQKKPPVPSKFEVEEDVTYIIGKGATFCTGVFSKEITTNWEMPVKGKIIVRNGGILKGSFVVDGGEIELEERAELQLINKMYLNRGAKLSAGKNARMMLDFTDNVFYTGANPVENIVVRLGGYVSIPDGEYMTVYLKTDKTDWSSTDKISVISGMTDQPQVSMIRPKFTGMPPEATWYKLPEVTAEVATHGATYGQWTLYIQFPFVENSYYFKVDEKDALDAIPFNSEWLRNAIGDEAFDSAKGNTAAIENLQEMILTPNANGCTPAAAYLLGYPADELETAKFLIETIPNTDTDDGSFAIHLQEAPEHGRYDMWSEVKFEVYEYENPDGTGKTRKVDESDSHQFVLPVPDGDDKVKYYRIRATYETW